MLPALIPRELVQSIESSGFITFCQRWIIKDRIDEIVHRSAQNHHRLPDMHQLAGSFADDVDAEQHSRLAMKNQLEPPRCVAPNLPARDLPVISYSHFVGHVLVCQLL